MHTKTLYHRLSSTAAAVFMAAAVWHVPVHADEPQAQSQCFSEQAKAYRLHAGDILRVSVWQEPNLSRELKLRPDGGFAYPLAGELMAQGLTLDQLRQNLTQKLSKFVAEPEVSISLVNTAKTVYVIGKVNRSTELNLNKSLTITQALAKAGGMTAFADSDEIQLIRQCDGKRQRVEFNYDKLSQGKALMSDITLRHGDLIVVP